MENHRKLWSRLVSRLRRGRTGYRCQQIFRPSSNISGTGLIHLNRSTSTPVVEGNASQTRFRDVIGLRTSFYEEAPHDQLVSRNNLVQFRVRLAEHHESFTPKCLQGFNTQNILLGQGTFENFSHNCWLENNLHRFCTYPTESLPDVMENDSLASDHALHIQAQLPRTSVQSFLQNIQVTNNNLTSSSSSHCSSLVSSQRSSSVSDISHFYNLNLTEFAFNPDSMIEDPPPYSELPEDPPPPYTETLQISTYPGRTQSDHLISASTQLLTEDCLY
ncbi:unnamed protein product [Lymnaea stagnalis]|uniref:Uncharacterized protein n=1 Tax=Lymnaea stagnalis TaxID=6523 RepID=A0AAV2HUU6_LYMST